MFYTTNNMQQTQRMTCWPDLSEETTINQPNGLVRQLMTVSEFTTGSKYGFACEWYKVPTNA